MVATGFVKQLSIDHPSIHIQEGNDFLWIAKDNTVKYNPEGDPVYLLHEMGHALLGHTNYSRDIELLAIERAAWTYAQEKLSDIYDIPIDQRTVEEALDTYREWLHARSTCPVCGLNGLQTKKLAYRCVSCNTTWSVNESKGCQLRRYIHK